MRSLIVLIFLSFLSISCSTEESQTDQAKDKKKLYKKTESYYEGILTTTQEVFYNSDLSIKSIELEEKDYYTRKYDIEYSKDKISEIIRITSYPNPDVADVIEIFDIISYEEDTIKLVSTNFDSTLEIFFSGKYVDSTKLYTTSRPDNVFKQTFKRNIQDQLISNNTGGENFNYSNFDSNKKPEPFNSVMEFEHSTFFFLFKLKVTRDNPLTASYNFSGGGSYSHYLDYDSQGYVTRVSYDEPNSESDYSINTYIEQL